MASEWSEILWSLAMAVIGGLAGYHLGRLDGWRERMKREEDADA